MNRKFGLLIGAITILYFLLHLLSLTKMPVFADEAIYIRWAQLILDDPGQYLFFPLNDGKTPLFIWLLAPFQYLMKDALFAGRLVSVLVGFVQLLLMGVILKEMKLGKRSVLLGMLLTAILPYWFIHHRLALMDGLLVLSASVAYLGVLRVINSKQAGWHEKSGYILLAIGFAMALWSKLPAVLLAPVFYFPLALRSYTGRKEIVAMVGKISISLGVGVGIFGLLWLHPAFGQLFSRGGDFLFPVKEILFAGLWRETLASLPTYAGYFLNYMTPALFILIVMGLFSNHGRNRTHVLFWSGLLFIFPIALLGKVVFPRYLFPAAFFFTLAAASAVDSLLTGWQKTNKKNVISMVIVALLLANVAASSLQFIVVHISNPNQTPFVSSDKGQYLESWSSGHGIKEVVNLMKSQPQTVAVATEGYFGTLPDGLNMYLYDEDVSRVYVEGIGQPVSSIPEYFSQRAETFDQQWLVVNSHRLEISMPEENLIKEFCRPNNAPCLQVWDISHLVNSGE